MKEDILLETLMDIKTLDFSIWWKQQISRFAQLTYNHGADNSTNTDWSMRPVLDFLVEATST